MARERSNRDDNHRRLFPIAKAKRLLDYKPQMEFMEGLKKVREWFVENWWNIEMNVESRRSWNGVKREIYMVDYVEKNRQMGYWAKIKVGRVNYYD